jgi:hypothetical protein
VAPHNDAVLQAVIDIENAKDDAVNELEKDLGELYGAYFDAVQAEVAKNKSLKSDDALSLAVALLLISRLRGLLRSKGGDRVMTSYASGFLPLAESAFGYFDAIGISPLADAVPGIPADQAGVKPLADTVGGVSGDAGGITALADAVAAAAPETAQAIALAEGVVLPPAVDRAIQKLTAGLEALGLDKADALAVIDHAVGQLGAAIELKLIPPVQSAILQANLAGQNRDQLIEAIENIREAATPAQAVQQADLTYAQWQRAVVAAKADELGMDLFRFVGPDDGITSKQCHAMLHLHPHGAPGVLFRDEITVADIERLAAQEGRHIAGLMRYDPMTTGGHPGCRHHYSPVTPEYAAEYGFRPKGNQE